MSAAPGEPVSLLGDPICADTDVKRYEIENKEKMFNANDKLVILFINIKHDLEA
jgi:hypothetical protein